MPITKLNPLSVAEPRTIMPISSLSPGLENIPDNSLAVEQPALFATLPPVSANRPSFADYEVTGFDGRGRQVLPLSDEALVSTAPTTAGVSLPSIGRTETASEVHQAIVSAAPDAAILTDVTITDLSFDEPVAAAGSAVATDFQTLGMVAFRMLDDMSSDWHPGTFHDLPPLSGAEFVMG